MTDRENLVAVLLEYYRALRSGFRFENSTSLRFAALNYIMNGKKPSVAGIKAVRDALRKQTGVFSDFRGLMLFSICALLDAGYSEGIEAVDRLIESAEILKKVGYKNSMYMPLCAYTLMKQAPEPGEPSRIPGRGLEIHALMRERHPFLTTREDYLLSLLMAARGNVSTEQLEKQMEICYTALHEAGFMKGNQLQFMSHILTLDGGDSREKARRCADIRSCLRDQGIRVPMSGSGSLAVLTLMSMETNNIVDRVIEVVRELRNTKGFRCTGKLEHIMLATGLAGHELVAGAGLEAVAGLTLQTILMAQQAAVIAAVAAAGASTAAYSG